jgi:hypothetical protein
MYLLSICIPTNGVSRWVVPNVRQIYSLGSDNNIFEVVVADNNPNAEMDAAMAEFSKYPNFRYVKTKAEGFYNIVENFVHARGDFMIKINHRCLMEKGSIERIYELGCRYIDRKPLVFLSNGILRENKILEYTTFDDYLKKLTFWSSLSEGLFFWKEDILEVPNISFAPMSPNVSLMFNSKSKNLFVIDDIKFGGAQDSKGKYGYDFFYTFAVLYLDLVNQVRIEGYLSNESYIKIKSDLYRWLRDIYIEMKIMGRKGNHSLNNLRLNIAVYYSNLDYYKMVASAWFLFVPKYCFNYVLRPWIKKLNESKKNT